MGNGKSIILSRLCERIVCRIWQGWSFVEFDKDDCLSDLTKMIVRRVGRRWLFVEFDKDDCSSSWTKMIVCRVGQRWLFVELDKDVFLFCFVCARLLIRVSFSRFWRKMFLSNLSLCCCCCWFGSDAVEWLARSFLITTRHQVLECLVWQTRNKIWSHWTKGREKTSIQFDQWMN